MTMRTLRFLIRTAGPGGSPLIRKWLLRRIPKEAARRLALPWNRQKEPPPWVKGGLWAAAAVTGMLIVLRLGKDSGRTLLRI